jgi:DNA-binding phage protein
VVDPDKLTYAIHLRDAEGITMSEIAAKTGIARATLYRHLPPRPAEPITAAGQPEPRA